MVEKQHQTEDWEHLAKLKGYHGVIKDGSGHRFLAFSHEGRLITQRLDTDILTNWYYKRRHKGLYNVIQTYNAQQELFESTLAQHPTIAQLVERTNSTPTNLSDSEVIALFRENGIDLPSEKYRKYVRYGVDERHLTSDGQVILYRGDYSDLAVICSHYLKKYGLSLDKTLSIERKRPLDRDDYYKNHLDYLMDLQAGNGRTPLISATSRIEIARKHPGFQEQTGNIYILKLPTSRVFPNSYRRVPGEEEFFIPDIILPSEILASISKSSPEYNDLQILVNNYAKPDEIVNYLQR
jgi:hypothetical protein